MQSCTECFQKYNNGQIKLWKKEHIDVFKGLNCQEKAPSTWEKIVISYDD